MPVKFPSFILLSFVIFCSCSSHSSNRLVEVRSLESDLVHFSVGPGRVEHILYQNDKLLITKGNSEEQIVVTDLKTRERSVKGRKGQGPGEIMNPWSLQRGQSNDEFWVASIGQKLLSQFSLNDKGTPLAKKQIKLAGEAVVIMEPLFLRNDTYIGTNLDGKSVFTIFNGQGKLIERIGDWSEKGKFGDYPDHVISSIYEGRLRTNPNGNKVSYACIALDRFMILDVASHEVQEFAGPFDIQPEFKVITDSGVPVFAPSPDTKFGFIDSYLGDDKLYLLYSGLSAKQIAQTGEMANQILVYDLKGELLNHFQLDHSLKAFTVDENNNLIYGLTSYVKEDVQVLKFTF